MSRKRNMTVSIDLALREGTRIKMKDGMPDTIEEVMRDDGWVEQNGQLVKSEQGAVCTYNREKKEIEVSLSENIRQKKTVTYDEDYGIDKQKVVENEEQKYRKRLSDRTEAIAQKMAETVNRKDLQEARMRQIEEQARAIDPDYEMLPVITDDKKIIVKVKLKVGE